MQTKQTNPTNQTVKPSKYTQDELTTFQTCTKCGISRSLSEYYRNSTQPDLHEKVCIPCRNGGEDSEYWQSILARRAKRDAKKPAPAPVATQPDAPKKNAKQVSRKEKPASDEKAEKSKKKSPKKTSDAHTEKAAKKKSKPTKKPKTGDAPAKKSKKVV